MQHLRNAVLSHLRIRVSVNGCCSPNYQDGTFKYWQLVHSCSSTSVNQDQVLGQVIGLVKKFGNIDAAKVTETADFQKDLNLDSLDRVELVMVFEEKFSIEIPDSEADKLKCCADVAKYITSGSYEKVSDSS